MKQFHRTFIISFLFILLCANTISARSITVSGWEILRDDAESIDDVRNKKNWEQIRIPSTFRVAHRDDETYRHLWLRGSFSIAGNPGEYFGISMGRVSISDATYINGILAGARSLETTGILSLPRSYTIPPGILKKGKNEVCIRLGMFVHNYGGIMESVMIQPKAEFDDIIFLRNVLYWQVPIGITLLFFILAVSLILAYITGLREKIIILNFIALAMLIIYIISMYLPFRIIKPHLSLSLQASLVPIFFILVMLMFQSVYHVYLTEYNRIIFPILITSTAVSILWNDTIAHILVSRIATVLNIILFLACFPPMIYRLNRLHPDRFRLIMVMLFSLTAGMITVLEIISEFSGWQSTDLIALYSSPFFIPIFVVMYAREFVRHRVELEFVYARLKSAELNAREITITDSSEAKLNRIIDFLKENFRSDISREGLAAAVGLNPNYMGTLFKTYTSKKINDYINELRIDEAKRLLGINDGKVIDIALSVGFESLATFNRIFKQVTGTTPSEYRKS